MVTPARAQYLKIKGQYTDSLLLFRILANIADGKLTLGRC